MNEQPNADDCRRENKRNAKVGEKGEPQGELIEQLKKEGYSEEDIRKIFAPHKYDIRLSGNTSPERKFK